MATREEFLRSVWEDINMPMQEHWIENSIRDSERRPDSPFAEVGGALQRLLACGASRRDLSLLVRHAAYESAFTTLYRLGDPGVDGDDIDGLHEELVTADPSGREGRPGSAPTRK